MIHLHQNYLSGRITVLIESDSIPAASSSTGPISRVTLDLRFGIAIAMAIPLKSCASSLITQIMSFLFLIWGNQKRFVRTVNHAHRYVVPGTKIALDNGLAVHVSTKGAVRAGYYACPTADALFRINRNLVTPELFVHRACETRVNAPGLGALATLDRERNLHISLHMYTR
jgi:uncharacterized C2H2 Zn-finger protein